MGTLLALEGAVAQGLLYAIMTLGVYITYKLLDFADLTVDGSFALGGCVSAILISRVGSVYKLINCNPCRYGVRCNNRIL